MPSQPPAATDQRTIDWAAINAVVSGDPSARYQLFVVEVVKYLSLYVPATLQFPAVLDGIALEQIQAAARAEEPGDEQKLWLAAFRQYRLEVVRGEQRNEKRLFALGEALSHIRRVAPGPRMAEAQQHRSLLERFLRERWSLMPPAPQDLPRVWAAQHAKRHDLLPRAWREL